MRVEVVIVPGRNVVDGHVVVKVSSARCGLAQLRELCCSVPRERHTLTRKATPWTRKPEASVLGSR